MKILNTVPLRELDKKNIQKNSSQKTGSSLMFAAELHKSNFEKGTYDQEVDDLRREIEHTGEKLEREPNLENFKAFRELLSRMAKRISSEAYRLEKIGGTAQNPRYYEIITVINSEADHLYHLVVHEQRNRMAITAKVIGIKGLVIDLIT